MSLCKSRTRTRKVDDYCGTKYWKASEVEKAPLMYSPIRADRWSCSHVILLDELRKENNPLRAIARKLKVQNKMATTIIA